MFEPPVTDVRGELCLKFKVVGLSEEHPNYYYSLERNQSRPCAIDGYNYLDKPSERADDLYLFLQDSYSEQVDLAQFNVPSECQDADFCGNGVCDNGLAEWA